MGELRIMGRRGDTLIVWDQDDPDEVAAARAAFEALKAKGFVSFSTKQGRGEQIKDFDPAIERIVVVPPMAGGGI